MKKYLLFFLLGFLMFSACKNDGKISDQGGESTGMTANKTNNSLKRGDNPKENISNTNEDDEGIMPLFNPCSLISTREIAKIMDIDPSSIQIKNSASSGKYSRSCFLSWENIDNGSKNRMFLMLQTNPLPGDFEDWAKSFIEAKKTNGDMGYPNMGKPYLYETVDGFDDVCAYNDELKRVFWRVNDEYVMAIFFNAGLTSNSRKKYALKIAKIMNKNFKKKS